MITKRFYFCIRLKFNEKGKVFLKKIKGGDFMPDIKCTVSSCHYYKNAGSKEVCTANAIEVNNLVSQPAKTSDETACKTFIPDVKA